MFEKVFNDFTNKYDFTNSDIKLKYNHSYRVRNLSLKYAHLLKFNERDTYIAEFIGLFHDIGRFTQLKEYNTYNDSKLMDHALEGVRILFEEGLINQFDFTEEEKNIIKFAIKNHNKYIIEYETDERVLMHAKLIRDIDKLDIVYIFGYLNELKLEIEDVSVDEYFLNSFKEEKLVEYKKLPNLSIIINFNYVYDINNDICIYEFENNIKEFYKTINNEKIFKEIYKYVLKYIEKRKKNARY